AMTRRRLAATRRGARHAPRRVAAKLPDESRPFMPRLFAIVLLLLAGPAVAAEPPVKITAVRVGFPAARADTQPGDVAKFACWAPVYVDLELPAAVADPA